MTIIAAAISAFALICIAISLEDIRTELFKLRVGDKSGDS